MTSRAETILTDRGDPQLVEYFGETAALTYRPRSGESRTVDAIVGPERTEREEETGGIILRHERQCYVASVDLVVAPQLNATAVVSGIEYSISGIGPLVGGRYRLTLMRHASAEVSRTNYRRID